MIWATRITLLLGIPWTLFYAFFLMIVLYSPTYTPDYLSPVFWLPILVVWFLPVGVVWSMLRLALGDRGRLR